MEHQFDCDLTREQRMEISQRRGETFVEELQSKLNVFGSRWKLTNLRLVPYYSHNCVFTCRSDVYGDVVLKFGYGSLENEYNCLREFAGRSVCRVFDADVPHNVILEHRIVPGNSLLDVESQSMRIDIFASLFTNLHVIPTHESAFPTLWDVVNSKLQYIQTREDCKLILEVVNKAKAAYRSVCSNYRSKKLLHGDLHHENILLSQDGNYLVIDPKGYIGDPVFDVSRFIMLEFDDNLTGVKESAIRDLIFQLEERLHIPSDVLIQSLFVDNLVWLGDDLERGETLDESQFIIDNIFAVERLLKND